MYLPIYFENLPLDSEQPGTKFDSISLFSPVKTDFNFLVLLGWYVSFVVKLFKYFLRSFSSMEFVRFNPLFNRSINCPLYMIEASSN